MMQQPLCLLACLHACSQVEVLYEDVNRAFGATILAQYFDKGWSAHSSLKSSLYDVETLAQVQRRVTGLHCGAWSLDRTQDDGLPLVTSPLHPQR